MPLASAIAPECQWHQKPGHFGDEEKATLQSASTWASSRGPDWLTDEGSIRSGGEGAADGTLPGKDAREYLRSFHEVRRVDYPFGRKIHEQVTARQVPRRAASSSSTLRIPIDSPAIGDEAAFTQVDQPPGGLSPVRELGTQGDVTHEG